MEIKKILVPVDFSSCSAAALRYAVDLARDLGAQLEVLHVLELPHYVIPDAMIEVPGDRRQSLTDFARGSAKKELDTMLGEFDLDPPTVTRAMVNGYPRDAILERVESGEYDLLVMGTHGRTGLSHLFLGSVAEQVVRRSPCPVLTIREDEKE